MPLINGICIPSVCYTRSLVPNSGKVWQMIIRSNNPVPQFTDVTNNPMGAGMLPQGLNQLRATADMKCDGCVCFGTRFNPPVQTPGSIFIQQSQDTDLSGVTTTYVYFVTADYNVHSLGNCFPPGTLVKDRSGKFVPVDHAEWLVQRGSSGAGGSGSGEGGKKPKKRTPPRRVKKAAPKKTKAKKPAAKKSKARKPSTRR